MAKSLNPRPGSAPAAPRPASKSIGNQRPAAPTQSQAAVSFAARQQARAVPNMQPAPQPRPVSQPAPANTSTDATSDFISLMRSMVEPFSIIDENVVRKNLQLMAGNGMTIDDRTISFECADYIMSNMAYIFMGLVLDKSFKNAFIESINMEVRIDQESDDTRKQLRNGMQNKEKFDSVGSMVLGFTSFVPTATKALMNKMTENFDKLDKYSGEFDAAVEKLTYEEKLQYGLIFSNFMYLIRAFTHNDIFMSYVIKVIEQVKKLLV